MNDGDDIESDPVVATLAGNGASNAIGHSPSSTTAIGTQLIEDFEVR